MQTYLADFLQKNQLSPDYLLTAKQHFTPLVKAIVQTRQASNKPAVFVGINGCQGSGKSTLCDYMTRVLINEHQLNTISCSLDDFYLDQLQRQQLAKSVHPLLASRGVPGTHDMLLLSDTLKKLANADTGFSLAKFDKASDNPVPHRLWPTVSAKTDIVLFEGWCWGTPPQQENELWFPVNRLEQEQDRQGIWRKFVNHQLAQFYQPLYRYMDLWLMLKAPSFDCVYRWRLEQEQKLRQKLADASGSNNIMTDTEIANFVQHFQRLSQHSLNTLPGKVDHLLTLDRDRRIIQS
ncbi:kinase [Thalassomonas sp. RHCl1]|uniref:kinase n=1 Tax=Thalassomonas sp. RHCl1 TaxID=2995320 RepID=UPI00248B91BB|nr:kinase [Thalassomonas sp. RHCl1]